MRCKRCEREVSDDMAFCPYCGGKIANGPAMSPRDEAVGTVQRLQPRSGKQQPEEELWSDTFSPKALFGPFIMLDLVLIVGLVGVALYWNSGMGWLTLGILILALYGGLGVYLLYQRFAVRYRVTTYRLFHERGIVSRATDRIEMIDIDDVTVHQGLIERMLGIGTLLIASSDRTHPQLKMPGIDNVKTVADLIDNARRAERERRGLHIESI